MWIERDRTASHPDEASQILLVRPDVLLNTGAVLKALTPTIDHPRNYSGTLTS
jgi:hypothetical protein